MRTVIYARFSSTLQNARSIEDQVSLCRERCEREGWDVVDVFTDFAISGAAGIDSNARPGLNALLNRVEAGGVDQVLAEATDRIARHQGDAFAIRERITFAGARLFTLSDGVVTEITATFRGLMDAQFRRDLAAKVKRGQRGTISDKRSAAGLAYGYRKANRLDDRGELIRGLREVDEDQAETVRRIFTEFAAGQSPRAIAERLNLDAVPAPGGRIGVVTFWRASTIYGDRKRKNGILQNRLYRGELVFNRTRKVMDPRTRKPVIVANPESEWQIEQVPHLRIVDDTLWQGVQDVLGQVQSRRATDARRPKHMLSGIARCGCCGGAWTIQGPNRWGCTRAKEGGAAACANRRTISTAIMERRVLAGLESQMLDPEAVSLYVQEYHLAHARRSKELERESGALKRRHAEASAKVDRLFAAIADGAGTYQELKDMLSTAREDRDRLAAELEQVESVPVLALHPNVAANYREQIADLSCLAHDPHNRLEVVPKLRALIESVVLVPIADQPRGLDIQVTGRLNAILALATGKALPGHMYGMNGAGEGDHAITSLVRVAV